jgi:hypothetical protein
VLTLPQLYARDRKGVMTVWAIHTEADVVVTEHGKLGGKMAVYRNRAKPTNEGRANARDGSAQAEFEAKAAWEKKLKEGYRDSMADAEKALILLPMLAHPRIAKRTKKVNGEKVMTEVIRPITFPCDVQRKFNGLRCLAVWSDGTPRFGDIPAGEFRMISREGVVWTTLGHLEAQLRQVMKPGDILDGEVYRENAPLQTLNSLIKRFQPGTLQLVFVVYDFPSIAAAWPIRRQELESKLGQASVATPGLILAKTRQCDSEVQLASMMAESVAKGYEGLIVRQWDKVYEFAQRCDALLKIKNFKDAEFTVVGALPREHIGIGTILDKFVCRVPLGDATFEVVPTGNLATVRVKYWENRDLYIGQRLTVRYLEESIDGIPQGNPVGIGFRLDGDLPSAELEELDDEA